MYKLINSTGTWYDTANVIGMYEQVKGPHNTQHGEARQSAARQGIAGHGTARRCTAEL